MTADTAPPDDPKSREKARGAALRAQIQGEVILERLQDFALGLLPEETIVSKAQIDTMRYLLDKVAPKVPEDAGNSAPNGQGGQPIVFNLSWNGEPMPLARFQQMKPTDALPHGQTEAE